MKLFKKQIFVWLLSALTLMTACTDDDRPMNAPTVDPVDSLVIADIYFHMYMSQWYNHWKLTQPTTWRGVDLEYNEEKKWYQVVGIHLSKSSVRIDGMRLPESLGNLKYLRVFDMNYVSGLGGDLPASLFDCPLEELTLICTELTNVLTSDIGKLKNTLRRLTICNYTSETEIPAELYSCDKLEYIRICNHRFGGKVPFEFSKFTHLHEGQLDLSDNDFTEMDWRYFTEDVPAVPILQFNNFKGEIPEEVLDSEKWEKYGDDVFRPFGNGFGFSNMPPYDSPIVVP